MRTFFITTMIFLTSGFALGQENQNPRPNTDAVLAEGSTLPLIRQSPPKISLPGALELAESHLKKQGIVASRYHLVEAKYTILWMHGELVPCWRFFWIKEAPRDAVEYDLEVMVFMSGFVWSPSVPKDAPNNSFNRTRN